MPVTPERARELCLALEGASEQPHFDRAGFRTPRKMFATLKAADETLNLMFDPDHRDQFCELDPAAFSPVPGGWGQKGATVCRLAFVDETMLAFAVQAAWRLAQPKPSSRGKS